MIKTKGSIQWASKEKQRYLGIHLILEFWGARDIEDPRLLERILRLTARKSGNTPIGFVHHKFNPHGITGVLLLAESHIAVHSWPEYQYLAVDIFTCGGRTFPERAMEYLVKKLKPKKIQKYLLKRGRIRVNAKDYL